MLRMNRLIQIILITLIFTVPSFAVVVYWTPSTPAPGGIVTIYYNAVEGTLPDNANPVYIHLGINGWSNVNDHAMSADSEPGWWKYVFTIPSNCEVIDFVFTDLQGNWDNNGGVGVDWHINLNYYWTPVNPNPNDEVTITVRNSGQGGDINWYVISQDNNRAPIAEYRPEGTILSADGKAAITPLNGPDGQGNYTLTFPPFTNARQIVDHVKFQIQWADGSWDESLFDIEADFTPAAGDPVITIDEPAAGSDISGTTTITVSGTNTENVELWGGIDSVATVYSAPFSADWTPSANNFGTVPVIARAANADGRVSFAFHDVNIAPQVVHEAAPSGTNDGVTVDGNTVTFALWAPAKNWVSVTGDFNEAFPNGQLMKLSGDTLWWFQTTLENGEYLYRYTIDGTRTIADPWSKDVSWKQPGTEYESGDYRDAFTRFEVGAQPYVWGDDDFIRPAIEDLIVYEVHVADNNGGGGTYMEMLDRVESGYFNELGINAIEFMPLNEFEGGSSWGYNPSFYMAPETAYGTPDELRMLVDACHQRGIAVLMDVVFNHLWGSAPLFLLYQPLDSWNYQDHDYVNDPYFANNASPWGYRLNHATWRTRKHIVDVMRTWVDEYHFDGFRFDHTEGIGWDGYNNSRMSYYSWWLRQHDDGLLLIAEQDDAYWINTTEMDAGWNYSYYHMAKANLQEITDGSHVYGDMNDLENEVIHWKQGYNDFYGPLNYIESHDETRVMYEATHYQGMTLEKAIKKSKLGAALLLTGQGTPMLYHGQEFGQNAPHRDNSGGPIAQPLQWSNLSTDWGANLFEYYQRLIWLRNNREILRGPAISTKLKDLSKKTIAFWRQSTEEKIVILANFSNSDQTVTLDFPAIGRWYEFTNDDSLELATNTLSNYVIPANTAHIFAKNRDWGDITTATGGPEADLPASFDLSQNYPNPFNPSTVIRYDLSSRAQIRLEVFDSLGRRVKELVNTHQAPGSYSVTWNGENDLHSPVASGVYIYRMTVQSDAGQSFSHVRKMLLIR
jgi:1,4-alpha-glucan branching enzyme